MESPQRRDYCRVRHSASEVDRCHAIFCAGLGGHCLPCGAFQPWFLASCVCPVTLLSCSYRKKQADGKLNALANAWSAGSSADISSTINFFYDGGPRDYFQDPELQKFAKAALTTIDPDKRKEAMRSLMDRTAEQAYAFPMFGKPWQSSRCATDQR